MKKYYMYICLLWCMSVYALNAQITATVKHVGPNNWGSITLQINGGAQPYGFKWYRLANIAGGGTLKVFLSNDQNLKDLEPNTYCVEVEDANCCKAEQCFTVKPCSAELIFREGIDYVVTPATSCNTKDGTIKIINPPTFDGITPALLLLNPPFSGSFLYPLQNSYFPGKYDILSYNNFSCRSDKSIEIKAKTTPEVIADIDYPCSLKDKGSINLSVSVPVYQNANSTYLWSNGATTNALKDVIAGVYCVTITTSFPSLPFGGLPTSCKFEKCYELGKNPLPLSMGSPKTTYSCVTNSGQIEVVAAGGSKPYSYKWSNGAITSLNSNIPSGIYSVTVTDRCGSQVIAKDVVIAIPKPISVSLSIQNPNDCALKTDINLLATALGGIPPLSYRWTVNGKKSFFGGSTHPIIYDGKYCVFVSDASDCNIASACFDTDISRIDTTQIPPCFGLSNGSLTIKFHNPPKVRVSVELNGILFQEILFPKVDEVITLSGLQDNQLMNIKAVFGPKNSSCFKEYSLKFKGKELVRSFNGYDSGKLKCLYSESCNGSILPTVHQANPTFKEIDYSNTFILKCSNDGFCADFNPYDQFAHPFKIKVPIKRVYVYEFKKLLESYLGGSNDAYIQNQLANIPIDKPCAKVRYCPLTLKMGWGTFFGFNASFTVNNAEPGCISFKCGTNSIVDCDNTVLGATQNCDLKIVYVYQLYEWINQLEKKYPKVFLNPNSEMFKFLNKYKNDQRRYCAKIGFCSNTFEIISTDILSVDCSPPGSCSLGDKCLTPMGGVIVNCMKKCIIPVANDPDCNKVIRTFISTTYNENNPWGKLQNTNENGTTTTVVGLGERSSRFNHFGVLADEAGAITPKGVFEVDNEKWLLNYRPYQESYELDYYPNITLFEQNIDNAQNLVLIEHDFGKKYGMSHPDELDEKAWYSYIESNNFLNPTNISTQNADFVLRGTFKGALTYNNTELETTTNEKLSNFTMVIDKQGKLLSFHSTPQFDEQYETIIFGKEKGTKAAGILLDDGIDLNASSHTTTTKGLQQFGIITLGNNETISRLAFDSGLTVTKTTYDEYNKRILCVVLGSGTMYFDSDEIQIGKSKSSASLLSIDETTGNLVWYRPIAVAETNIDNMQITSSADGCYLGFNYEGGLDIDGKTIENVGNKDIAIVSIDPEGRLNGYKNFGSPDNETVKSLLYTKGVLYFGGDLEGTAVERNIGKNRFIKIGNNQSDAYITFVPDLDFKSDVPGSKAQSTNVKFGNNIKSQFSVQEITASPIPFKDRISVNVRVAEMQVYDIQILDVLGKSVERLQRTLLKGYNVVDIDNLENLKAGVYIVKVMEASGMFKSIKIVKN